MMNKVTAFFVVVAGSLLLMSLFGALKAAPQDGSKSHAFGEVCMLDSKAVKFLETHGEHPILEWSFADLQHNLFWDPEDGSWTIFARHPTKKDHLCVISEGHKMKVPERVSGPGI